MGTIRGLDCKVYYNSSTDTDPYANPVWTLWPCVKDTTLSLEFDEADATCRGSGGFKQAASTLGNLEIDGNAVKDRSDTSFVAMEAAAVAQTVLEVLVMDGPKAAATSNGWRLPVQIRTWTENQPMDDVVTVDFALKPARTTHSPAKMTGPITV